ncbi:MAG: ECF transporter S component [Oscillospiraceae bacterium]|nr:ECF transporter S component [Oscillospiraceae bacterium]
MDTKKFIRTAMLTALACVLTIIPKVPIGGGYVHFGDCIIYVAAIMMGSLPGAIVGAVGHSLADLLSGFAIFCVPTFIIKAVMGFTIGKIVHKNIDAKHFILGGIAAFVIVTGGYFIAEIPLMGYETALISLISSPIQWAMSVAASAVILPILVKNRNRLGF